jgi:hypothetical protein
LQRIDGAKSVNDVSESDVDEGGKLRIDGIAMLVDDVSESDVDEDEVGILRSDAISRSDSERKVDEDVVVLPILKTAFLMTLTVVVTFWVFPCDEM